MICRYLYYTPTHTNDAITVSKLFFQRLIETIILLSLSLYLPT